MTVKRRTAILISGRGSNTLSDSQSRRWRRRWRKVPPAGPDWLHEVKFDGWRAQIHIEDGAATLYSKNGADITRRFSSLRPALARVESAVVDCELIACDETGMPSFRSLMNLGNKAPCSPGRC